MPTFNNLYKMPVTIYFGDLEPSTSFYHDKISKHLFVGSMDYGKFGNKVFDEIVCAWNEYKSTHYFDPDRYRWYERKVT